MKGRRFNAISVRHDAFVAFTMDIGVTTAPGSVCQCPKSLWGERSAWVWGSCPQHSVSSPTNKSFVPLPQGAMSPGWGNSGPWDQGPPLGESAGWIPRAFAVRASIARAVIRWVPWSNSANGVDWLQPGFQVIFPSQVWFCALIWEPPSSLLGACASRY